MKLSERKNIVGSKLCGCEFKMVASAWNSELVSDKSLEKGIIKLQRNQANLLTRNEKGACKQTPLESLLQEFCKIPKCSNKLNYYSKDICASWAS